MDPHNASGYADAPGGTTASGHAYSYQSHAPPPPTAGPPTAPAAPQNHQTHQYGYGYGFDNYVYGADQHAQPASQTSAPAQAQPNVPGHATAPAPAPATPSHFLNQPLPQKLSLSSFSGKKSSAWLKKNVSPRLDNVARSSLVQGSIKELGNAYTAARGMADNYSAKYYASQAQQQQQFTQHGQHGQHSQHSQTHGSYNTGGHVPWHSPQSATSPNAAASPAAAQSAAPWSHVHDQQAASAPSPTGQPTWASPTPPASTASWGHNHGQQTSSAPPPAGQPTWTLPTPPASTASWSHDHIQQTTSASAAASQPTWTTHTPPASTAPWSQDLHPPHPPAASPAWHQPSQSPGVPASAVGSSLIDPTSRSAESPSTQPTLPAVQPQAVPARRPVQGSISRKPVNAPQQTGETIRPVETHDGSTAFLVINHDRKQATRVITSPTGDRTFVEEAYPGPDPPVVEQDNKAAVTYPPVTEVPRENHQWNVPLVTQVQEHHHQPAAPTVMQSAREKPVSDPLYDPLALAAPIGTSAGAALRLCPGLRTVSYATTWHHLKGLPDFGICSYCFSKHIGSSPLAHEFDTIVKAKGLCRFNVPRVTKSLWPDAQRTSSVAALRNYVSRRMAIPACTKKGGAVGADGVKWFGLVGGELGMVACEACHEDEVAGTSFAGRFEPLRQVQGASERWICTISYEHVSRCLQIFSARDAWSEFVAAAGKRMALPDCSETMGSATSRNWYRPIRPTGDLDICEACYLDSLALTELGEHFAETGESFEQKLCMRICDLQLMNLSEALVVCRTKGLGIDAFLRAAGKIASSPRCYKKAGITDGRFYNFAGTSAANFGVCEGCHAGILEPHGVAPLFGSEPKLIQGTAWCAFNPSVERFGGLVDHWLEAVETGAWPTYERWVTRYAALPTCPNFNMVPGRRWYGWDDLPMCPECYETVAEGTQLASSFELRDTSVEGERLCSAYSEHMRGRWAKAISEGDAAGLREFNKYRMSVYAQTVPRFKMLAQMQTMQNQLALSQMMLGLSLQHADAISGWGGSSGYEYGNSSLGYHSSQYGVDSAKAFDEGRATMARANGPIAEASYLKDVWQAVE